MYVSLYFGLNHVVINLDQYKTRMHGTLYFNPNRVYFFYAPL